MADNKCIWKERKRLLLFGLPWTFTIYSLDSEALNVQTGFFSQKFEEIKLYRIRDFTVRRSFFQRMFGLGTVHICSADSSSPEYDLKNIKNCMEVKKLISDQVELAKDKSGVKTSEFISDRPERVNF